MDFLIWFADQAKFLVGIKNPEHVYMESSYSP